jgi:hypothetical protein
MSEEKRPMTAADLLDLIEVERLTLEPGDTLVLKCSRLLTAAEFDAIGEQFKANLPGTKVLILEGSVDLAVLRAET